MKSKCKSGSANSNEEVDVLLRQYEDTKNGCGVAVMGWGSGTKDDSSIQHACLQFQADMVRGQYSYETLLTFMQRT